MGVSRRHQGGQCDWGSLGKGPGISGGVPEADMLKGFVFFFSKCDGKPQERSEQSGDMVRLSGCCVKNSPKGRKVQAERKESSAGIQARGDGRLDETTASQPQRSHHFGLGKSRVGGLCCVWEDV